MTGDNDRSHRSSRRGFLAVAAGMAVAGTGANAAERSDVEPGVPAVDREEFWGTHQSGIATPQQSHTYFAALDLVARTTSEVIDLMRVWTAAAARLTAGKTAKPLGAVDQPGADSGEALDLGASRLTLTFGFGAGLFSKEGQDRYGLAALRPAALVDLPKFNGDQIDPARSGGDLMLQACAQDPQVAFHAVRQLVRLSYGKTELRWTQAGFRSGARNETPRNLMGFKDGTQQPGNLDDIVWVGDEGPPWMRHGSYLVARKIRIALEHWDRTPVDYQGQVVGRDKYTGAPLGAKSENDPLPLSAVDASGNSVIPDGAHVRLATAASNDGAQMLRRAYSYNDGLNFTAERWPPWRQAMEYDAGLLFLCYQRDPRTGFIKIFAPMSQLDALNQFTTHVGSATFACPGGALDGEFIGQRLFRSA